MSNQQYAGNAAPKAMRDAASRPSEVIASGPSPSRKNQLKHSKERKAAVDVKREISSVKRDATAIATGKATPTQINKVGSVAIDICTISISLPSPLPKVRRNVEIDVSLFAGWQRDRDQVHDRRSGQQRLRFYLRTGVVLIEPVPFRSYSLSFAVRSGKIDCMLRGRTVAMGDVRPRRRRGLASHETCRKNDSQHYTPHTIPPR